MNQEAKKVARKVARNLQILWSKISARQPQKIIAYPLDMVLAWIIYSDENTGFGGKNTTIPLKSFELIKPHSLLGWTIVGAIKELERFTNFSDINIKNRLNKKDLQN